MVSCKYGVCNRESNSVISHLCVPHLYEAWSLLSCAWAAAHVMLHGVCATSHAQAVCSLCHSCKHMRRIGCHAVGFPLTDAQLSSSYTVLSAHAPDKTDWSAYAKLDTLVILMAGNTIHAVMSHLQQSGWNAETPVSPKPDRYVAGLACRITVCIAHCPCGLQQVLHLGTRSGLVSLLAREVPNRFCSCVCVLTGRTRWSSLLARLAQTHCQAHLTVWTCLLFRVCHDLMFFTAGCCDQMGWNRKARSVEGDH